MVTEYIKRGYRKGYDEDGKLVYKVRLDQSIPLEVVEEDSEEETPPLNLA